MTQQDPAMRALLQRALARIEELERALGAQQRGVPVAVIGVGCRLPGGVRDLDGLAALLDEGRDAVTEIAPPRWTPAPLRRQDGPVERSGRWAGQIDEVDLFDAAFFGISPREALSLDPQHRLLLEVAWEALEDAGVVPASLAGGRVGVYVGATSADYLERVLAQGDEALDAYAFTGNQLSVAAGRVSYTLGLQGPAMTIDTACSSSLVAVHEAMRHLRRGEADLALAGGVNLVLDPTHMRMATRLQALSPEGRCKTFDAGADGFARGEGVVLVALKRLPDALRDGDAIRGVLLGSAVNQDGRSTGLTAPNPVAQQALMREALQDAGLSPIDVDCVEAHGTGTPLGDPIEIEAIARVYGAPRPGGGRLRVSSVKTNLGHTEAAAGATGLLKVLASLDRGRFFRHLHLDVLNPRIRLEGTCVHIPTAAEPWPRGARPRVGAVSSFGLSGTNAHVLVGEAPARPAPAPLPERGAELLPISARSPGALAALARGLLPLLKRPDGPSLRELAAALARRRSRHDHRLGLVVGSKAEAVAALQSWVESGASPGARTGHAPEGRRPRLAFVFPGQGSQSSGMCAQLRREEPVFREALDAAGAALAPFLSRPLAEILAPGEPLTHIDEVQPALFAVSVALAALWRSLGLVPDVLIGHSMGEVAAAAVSGALSLPDAARVIALRSRLLRRVAGQGAMAVVELGAEDAERALRPVADRVSVAVRNSRRATVLSGDPAALDEVLARLDAEGVFTRRVRVDVASHSPLMDPLTADLMEALAPVRPSAGQVPLRSTVDGSLGRGEGMDAAYWVKNLRWPVRFAEAVEATLEDGPTVFLECSPHPILVPVLEDALVGAGPGSAAVGSLRREADERRSLLDGLAALSACGLDPRWEVLHPGVPPLVPLPRYPWQGERAWLDHAARPQGAGQGHPLGAVEADLDLDEGGSLRQGVLDPSRQEWLGDHRVGGAVVLPAAAMVEALLGAGPVTLRDLRLAEAMVFTGGPRRVEVLARRSGGEERLSLSSRPAEGGAWIRHATATREPDAALELEPLSALRAKAWRPVDLGTYRAGLQARGLEFGAAFWGMSALSVAEGEALVEVKATDAVSADRAPWRVHPALLDAALQGALAVLEPSAAGALVPVGARRVALRLDGPAALTAHLRRAPGGEGLELDVALYDEAGLAVGHIEGLKLAPLEAEAAPIWRVQAVPLPALTLGAPSPGRWLARAGEGLGQRVIAGLRARGHEVVSVGLEAKDLDARAAEAFEGRGGPLGLLDLAGLEPAPEGELARGWEARPGGLLALVRAALGLGLRDPPRLVVLTRGAHPGAGEAGDPLAAASHALGLAVAYEHAELRPRRIDLGPGEPELEPLLAEIEAVNAEDVRLSREGRAGLRLSPSRAPMPVVAPLGRPGTWLVSGGLGGLGLSLARWLGERGAPRILLASRSSGRTAAQEQGLAAARATGAQVEHVVLDVADEAAVLRLFAERAAASEPIVGVVHAAVVLRDGLLADQGPAALAEVMAPKVLGAWSLHLASLRFPVERFVLYGSAACVLGSPAQSGYMAANAFLGGLAHARRAAGQHALCIDWGAFSEAGAAAADARRGERLAGRGLQGLRPEEGERWLGELLAADEVRAAVLRLQPRQWLEFHPQVGSLPYLSALREAGSAAGGSDLGERLASSADPGRLMVQHVREQVAAVLRLPVARLEPSKPLRELGADSLMGLEIRNRLESSTGLRLPATLIWSYPTVAALAAHLSEALRPPAPPEPPPPPETRADPTPALPRSEEDLAQALSELSEAEKEALLEAQLAALEDLLA